MVAVLAQFVATGSWSLTLVDVLAVVAVLAQLTVKGMWIADAGEHPVSSSLLPYMKLFAMASVQLVVVSMTSVQLVVMAIYAALGNILHSSRRGARVQSTAV